MFIGHVDVLCFEMPRREYAHVDLGLFNQYFIIDQQELFTCWRIGILSDICIENILPL